jgi:hypothetical protein
VRFLRAYFFRVIRVFSHNKASHAFLMRKTNNRDTSR